MARDETLRRLSAMGSSAMWDMWSTLDMPPTAAERKRQEDYRRKVGELESLPTEKDWGVFGEEE